MPPLSTPLDGHDHSQCWCQAQYVIVSIDDIRRGLTRPCSRKRCIAIANDAMVPV